MKGLSFTAGTYQAAVDLLKDRFGRKELIIFSHIQALLSYNFDAKGKGKGYISSLWSLYDDLLTHIRSLEVLGVAGKECQVFLTPIILTRLPSALRLEWSRDGSGKESDLEYLLEFLKTEIERHERSETFNQVNLPSLKQNQEAERKKSHHTPAAAALLAGSTSGSVGADGGSKGGNSGPRCVFCEKTHVSGNCYSIVKLPYEDRYKKILSLGLCFRCLKKGHSGRECMSTYRCKNCNDCRHNYLMCRHFNTAGNQSGGNVSSGNSLNAPSQSQNPHYDSRSAHLALAPPAGPVYYPAPAAFQAPYVSNGSSSSSNNNSVVNLGICHNTTKSCTILQTAKIPLLSHDGSFVVAKVLFDTGADRSYISSKFNQKIKANCVGSEYLSYTSFGGGKSTRSLRKIVSLDLIDQNQVKHQMNALVIPSICEPISKPTVPVSILDKFSHLPLANNQSSSSFEIDVIIGMDIYFRFMLPQTYRVDNLVAINSIFGYIICGTYDIEASKDCASTQLLCINHITDDDIQNFWSLESVGISDTMKCLDRD